MVPLLPHISSDSPAELRGISAAGRIAMSLASWAARVERVNANETAHLSQSMLPASHRRGLIGSRPWRLARTKAKKGPGEGASVGEELLDFMYAGKKLRKWYGEEGMVLPKDGGPQPEQEEEPEEEEVERDQILVLDADSPTGEQVVLQLILARTKIRALVKDASAASAGFGPYIQAVQGSASDPRALRSALRGTRAVIAAGSLGALLPAAEAAGVQHLVLLSSVGAPRRGLGMLFGGGEQGVLGDAERERAAMASGIPCTVVQVGCILDEPGGTSEIAVTSGRQPAGEISREDAARVLARAAAGEPPEGTVVLQAQSSGSPSDWEAALDSLVQKQVA